MDLKHMDSALHEKFTGVPNERILENIKQLAGAFGKSGHSDSDD